MRHFDVIPTHERPLRAPNVSRPLAAN